MWKAAAGAQINLKSNEIEDDDWDTDPDFVNNVDEQQQRWGSTTIEGSGRTAGAIDMEKLRKETEESDAFKKKQETPNTSYGYGGKFGVQTDRMDQSAVGHDYVGKVEKHASQKDYSTGFGGKFGVQKDRVDKSAVSWEHKEKPQKHASQKDYSSGFGGKFGVQSDRQDKSAVGWDHVEKVAKHESQKDYSKGFGGKFGVQTDRQDKSAVGWDHHEAAQKHESQLDHKKGFGGKFGIQSDRMDKSAATFDEPAQVGTNYSKTKPEIGGTKPSELRAKFENLSQTPDTPIVKSPTPKSSVHAKAAMFNNKTEPITSPTTENRPKQLDQSKVAFLTENNQTNVEVVEKVTPGQLDKNKFTQFDNTKNVPTSNPIIQEELEQLKSMQQEKQTQQVVKEEEEEVKPVETIEIKPQEEIKQVAKESEEETEVQYVQEDDIVDTGLTATALYDYQASAEDEISFDPDDIITHVEMIDEGWWRGMCKGRYGLFPANYVQLQQ